MITRDDLSVDYNANSITVSAMIAGQREKTQYIGWDEDGAVADFLANHNGDDSMMIECPNHDGAFDCTPFCELCNGEQEYEEETH